MKPKCDACPVAAGECKSYPHLCKKLAELPAVYRPIVDQVNGLAVSTPAEDAELRAYVAQHGCGGC